jgi:proteasome lid subunit RPN8/RPN11
MIRISANDWSALRSEARLSYPEECCGALLGRAGGDATPEVARAVPIYNGRADQRERRYLIGPDEVRVLEDAADRAGLDVLGFYHSHPDHPAVPSTFDQDHAWPWYTYVIVPVAEGEPGDPRAWKLSSDRSEFREVRVLKRSPR